MRVRALLAFVAVLACHRAPTPTQPPAPEPEPSAQEPADASPPADASIDLAAMEKALLERALNLRFDIAASGAVQARLVGELRLDGERLALRASGTFAGNQVEVSLDADGERLTGTNGTAKLDFPQPPELADAIVVGLVRMGILHNLAMLIAGRPLDHAEGDVREWVVARDVVAEARVTQGLSDEARRQASDAMSFAITVSGNEAGEATLWWDRATSLPVERHQVVRFAEGEMHVRETYTPVE